MADATRSRGLQSKPARGGHGGKARANSSTKNQQSSSPKASPYGSSTATVLPRIDRRSADALTARQTTSSPPTPVSPQERDISTIPIPLRRPSSKASNVFEMENSPTYHGDDADGASTKSAWCTPRAPTPTDIDRSHLEAFFASATQEADAPNSLATSDALATPTRLKSIEEILQSNDQLYSIDLDGLSAENEKFFEISGSASQHIDAIQNELPSIAESLQYTKDSLSGLSGGIAMLHREYDAEKQRILDQLTAAVDQNADEMVALAESHATETAQLTEQHLKQMHDTCADFEQKISSLESRLIDSETSYKEERKQLRDVSEAQLKSLEIVKQEELETAKMIAQEKLQAMEKASKEQLEQTEREASEQFEQLRSTSVAKYDELQRSSSSALEQLRASSTHDYQELKDRSEKEIADLKRNAAQELSSTRYKLNSEIETLKRDSVAELSALSEKSNRELQELRRKKESEIEQLRESLSAEIARISNEAADERIRMHKVREEQVRHLEERRAQETSALRDELELARNDHEKEIVDLHTHYKSRITDMEESFAAEQSTIISTHTAQVNELVRKAASELSNSVEQYEDKFRTLSETHSTELKRTIQQAALERESLVARYESDASKADEERRQEREALVLKYETSMEALRRATREQLEQSTSEHEMYVTQLRDSCAGKVLALENTLREQEAQSSEKLAHTTSELETSKQRVQELEENQQSLRQEHSIFVERSVEQVASKEMAIAHQEALVLRFDAELRKAQTLLDETERKLRFTEDDRQVKAGTILELTFVIKSRDEEIEKLRHSLLDSIKTVTTKTEIIEMTTETLSTKAKELEDTRAALRLESGRLSRVEESMHQKEGILEDTTMKIETMRLNMENLRLEMKRMQMDMKLQLEHSESEMELKNGEIRRLHGTVGELKLKNDFSQQTIERLEDALGQAHRQGDEAQRRINLLKLEAGNSGEELKKISDQLNEREADLLHLSKDKQVLMSERNRLMVQLSTSNQLVQRLQEQIECCMMLGDETQTRYRRVLERTITEKDERLRTEKKLLTLELTAAQDALRYLEGVDERYKQCAQEADELKTERSSLKIEITSLKDTVTRLDEELQHSQSKVREQTSCYHELEDTMKSSEARLNTQLDSERRRVIELQSAVEDTGVKLQEALSSGHQLGREKKQLQDDLGRAARDHEFLIASANMEKTETLENISRRQIELSERDAELRQVREERLKLQERAEITQNKLDHFSNELQRVNEQLLARIDECCNLQTRVHELEAVRDHLEAQQNQEAKDFMATQKVLEGEIAKHVAHIHTLESMLNQSSESLLLTLEDTRTLICGITESARVIEADLNAQLCQVNIAMKDALHSAEESKFESLNKAEQEKAEALQTLLDDHRIATQELIEEKNSAIQTLQSTQVEIVQRLQNEKEEIMRLADEERWMLLRVAEEDKLAILRQAEEEKSELSLQQQIRESASRTHRSQERERLRRLAKYEQERLTELNESAQMLSEEQQTRLFAEISRTKDENATLQIQHCLSEAAATLQLVQEQEQLRKMAHEERVRLLEMNEVTRMVAEEHRARLLDKEVERERLLDEKQTAMLLEQHAREQMAKEEECTHLLVRHLKAKEIVSQQQEHFREQHERFFMWNAEYETRLFVAHIVDVEALQDSHATEKSKLATELAEVKRVLDAQMAKADADKREWEVSHVSTLSSTAERHQYELLQSAKCAQEESARIKEKLEAEKDALSRGFEQTAEVIRLRTSEEYLLKINEMLQRSREEGKKHAIVVDGLQRELGAARAELAAVSKHLELQTRGMGDTERQLVEKTAALNADVQYKQVEMQRQLDAKQRELDEMVAAKQRETDDQIALKELELRQKMAANQAEIESHKSKLTQLISEKEHEMEEMLRERQLAADNTLASIQADLAKARDTVSEKTATIDNLRKELAILFETTEGTRSAEQLLASLRQQIDSHLADSCSLSLSNIEDNSLGSEEAIFECIKSYLDLRCINYPTVLTADEVRCRLEDYDRISALLRGDFIETSTVCSDAVTAVEGLQKGLNLLRTSVQELAFGNSDISLTTPSHVLASFLDSFQGFFRSLRLAGATASDRELRQHEVHTIIAQHEQLMIAISTSSECDSIQSVSDVCLFFETLKGMLERTREITGCPEFRCLGDLNKVLDECAAVREHVSDFKIETDRLTAEAAGPVTNFIGAADVSALLNEFEEFVSNCRSALGLDQHNHMEQILTAIEDLMAILHHFEAIQPELGSPRRQSDESSQTESLTTEKPPLKSKVEAIVSFVNELKSMSEFAQSILDEECDEAAELGSDFSSTSLVSLRSLARTPTPIFNMAEVNSDLVGAVEGSVDELELEVAIASDEVKDGESIPALSASPSAFMADSLLDISLVMSDHQRLLAETAHLVTKTSRQGTRDKRPINFGHEVSRIVREHCALLSLTRRLFKVRDARHDLPSLLECVAILQRQMQDLPHLRRCQKGDSSNNTSRESLNQGSDWGHSLADSTSDVASNSTASFQGSEQALRYSLSIFSTIEEAARHLQDYNFLIHQLRKGSKSPDQVISSAAFSNNETLASEIIEHENVLIASKSELGLENVVTELPVVVATLRNLMERTYPLILRQPFVGSSSSVNSISDEDQLAGRSAVPLASVPEEISAKCDEIVSTLTEFNSLAIWMRRTLLNIPEQNTDGTDPNADVPATLEFVDMVSLRDLKQYVRDFVTQLCELQLSNQALEHELTELNQTQQQMLQELRNESDLLSRLDSDPVTPPSPNRRRADVLEGLLARQEAFRRQSSFQSREDLREVVFLRGAGLLVDVEEGTSNGEKNNAILSSTTRLAIYKRLVDENHLLERQLQSTKAEHASVIAHIEATTQKLQRQSETDKHNERELLAQILSTAKEARSDAEVRHDAEKKVLETKIEDLRQNLKSLEAQFTSDKQSLEQQFNRNLIDAESRFEVELASIKGTLEEECHILVNEKKSLEQQLIDQCGQLEQRLDDWRLQAQTALDEELALLRGNNELAFCVDEYERSEECRNRNENGWSRMNVWKSLIVYIDRLMSELTQRDRSDVEELEFLKSNHFLDGNTDSEMNTLTSIRKALYKNLLAARERENTWHQDVQREAEFVRNEVKVAFDEGHPEASRLNVYRALLEGQNALIEDKMERELEAARETAYLEAHNLSFDSRMRALEHLVRACEQLEIAKKHVLEEQALLVEQRVCTPQELRPSLHSSEGKPVTTELQSDNCDGEHTLEGFASIRLDVYRKLLASEQQTREEMTSREAAWGKELNEIHNQHAEEESSWKSDVRELENQQQERETAWENERETLKHGHLERGMEWERELHALKQLHMERETALITRLQILESELENGRTKWEDELTRLKAQLEEKQTAWRHNVEVYESAIMHCEEQWTRAAFDDSWATEQALEKARTLQALEEQKRKEIANAMEIWTKESEAATVEAVSVATATAKAESEASYKDEIERLERDCDERIKSLTATHLSRLARLTVVREESEKHAKQEITEAVARSVAVMRATLLERLAKRDGDAVATIYRCIRMATDVLSPSMTGSLATVDTSKAPPSRHGTSSGLSNGSTGDKIPVGVTQAVVTLVKELKALKEHIAASLDALQIEQSESSNNSESVQAPPFSISPAFVPGKGEILDTDANSTVDPTTVSGQEKVTDITLCAYRELMQYTEQQLIVRQQAVNDSLARLYTLVLGVESSIASGEATSEVTLQSAALRDRVTLEIELAKVKTACENFQCKQRLHDTYVRRLLEDQRAMEIALSKTLEGSQVECKQLQARIEQLEHYQRLALASSGGGIGFQASPNSTRPLMPPPSRGAGTSNASSMIQVPMRPDRPREYPSSMGKGGGTTHKEKFVSDLEKDTGQRRTGPGVSNSMGFGGGDSPSAARRRRQFPGGIGDLDASSLSLSPSSSSIPARGSLLDQELWFQGVRTLHFVAFFVSVFHVPKQGVFRVEVLNSDTDQQQTVYVPRVEMQQFLSQHERDKRRRFDHSSLPSGDVEEDVNALLEDPGKRNEVVDALFEHVKVYGEGTSNMLLAFE